MKVSIVIPTYNSQEIISSALDSIVSQTYQDIEIVVMDGGSKDETANIVKKYQEAHPNKIVFVSEKDKGVFDALNKGVQKATGELIGWMGSDDFYANTTVIETAVAAIQKSGAMMCWGDLQYVDKDDTSKVLRYWKSSQYKKGMFQHGWQMPHFASFVKKEVFAQNGYFNLEFRIAADYDFFLRILEKNGVSSTYIPKVFMNMRAGGQSNQSWKNIIEGNKDCYRAWKKNGLSVNPFLLFATKPFTKMMQFIRKAPSQKKS